MTSYNEFEKQIKGLSDEHQLAAPPMVWDNIESELDNKKNRGLLYFILGIALLLIIFLTFNFLDSENKQLAPGIIENTKQQSQYEDKPLNEKPTIINRQHKEGKLYEESNKQETTENEQSKNTQLNSFGGTKEEFKSKTSKQTNSTSKNISNKTTKSKALNNVNKELSKAEKNLGTVKNNGLSKNANNIDSGHSSVLENNEISARSDDNEKVNSDLLVELQESKASAPQEKEDIKLEKIENLPLLINRTFVLTIPTRPTKVASDYSENQILVVDKSNNFFFEFGPNIGYTQKNFNSNNRNDVAVQLRSLTEKQSISFGGNLAVGKYLNENTYVGIGAEYIDSRELFFSVNDSVFIEQDTFYTFFPESIHSGSNKYKSLDIEVFGGYLKQFKSFGLGVELGLQYNLNFKNSGMINELQDQMVDQSEVLESDNFIVKNKVGLGYRISLNIEKDIGPSLTLFCKPTYRRYLKPINQNSYPIETNFGNLSLRLGARVKF